MIWHKADIIIIVISLNVTSSRLMYRKMSHLALNSNHSLSHSTLVYIVTHKLLQLIDCCLKSNEQYFCNIHDKNILQTIRVIRYYRDGPGLWTDDLLTTVTHFKSILSRKESMAFSTDDVYIYVPFLGRVLYLNHRSSPLDASFRGSCTPKRRNYVLLVSTVL